MRDFEPGESIAENIAQATLTQSENDLSDIKVKCTSFKIRDIRLLGLRNKIISFVSLTLHCVHINIKILLIITTRVCG